MDSKAVLKAALGVVRKEMKGRGFASKGTSFCRKTAEGNTEIVSVQKSVKSSSAESFVTLNFGVYSAVVGNKLGDDASFSSEISEAHWHTRLTQGGREKWLPVKATDSAEGAAKLILDAVDVALSELEERSKDEQLRDAWMAGLSPGIVNIRRLLFLAILVKELGPAEQLPGVVAELRRLVEGSVHASLMERQLALAGIQVP